MSRSYEIHVNRKKRRLGCGRICRLRRYLSYGILTSYERAFERLGFFLARKPSIVLLVSLIVVTVSCLGFVRLRAEQPSVERFTAADSQSRKDLHHAAQYFPLLEARQEQIIMIPRYGQNILTDDCLKDAIFVHQTIVNITGYSKVCFKQLLPNIQQKLEQHDCITSSPLELAGTQFENLSNLSSILVREFLNPNVVLSSGQTFNSSFKRMLSNFQVQRNTDSLTAQADALRVIYFIKTTTIKEEDQAVLNFETSFESLLLSLGHRLKCAKLYFKTGKATNDALENVLKPELWPLYFSPLAMTVLIFIVFYLSSNNLSCLTTVLLMISSILLPMTCSAGIISMANISFSPTTLFIPFLLLGKATSDVVLFLVEWERQKKVPSLEHRVASCVTKAGFIAAFSALCGTILSGIPVASSFDETSDFFLATLLTYAIVSTASSVVTVILLMYFERRLKKLYTPCTRSNRRRSSITEFESVDQLTLQCRKSKLRHMLKSVAGLITSLGGKIISLFILVGIISVCVLSALKTDQRTNTIESLYQDHNFKQFNEAQKKFFGDEIDTSIVFSENIDYSKETIQNQIADICIKLQEASYSDGELFCWMTAFRQWKRNQNKSCSDSEFYPCLERFLDQSHNVRFQQDLRFEDMKARVKILASRIHLKMKQLNQFREDRRSLHNLRKALIKLSSLKAVPVSDTFFTLDDLYLLEQEIAFTVFITATIVVFIYSLFSTSSFVISIFVALTFGFLLLEAMAIMGAWEIRLNHISFLSLFLTIVLSLNFTIQVAYSFVFSAKQTIRFRMMEALRSVGWSVLTATLITICGSVSLGFIYPCLTEIFHRLLPLVLILGLVHALVIFPPIIVLFLEFINTCDPRNDVQIPATNRTRNNEISLQVRDGDVRQPQPKRPGISIVGISCRFPGASSKDQFWHFLEQGKSSNGVFPNNRPEQHKTFFELYHPRRFVSGRLSAVNGSYLEEITHFDNNFFGISNQEARGMDPQQRILLQVVYEAIEDAGMRLEDLQKCRTGVFVGVMNLDYGALVADKSNYPNIDQFSSTGGSMSIIANRVSFCLNLTGPSLAVDTACSSSITALKIACDNLHNEDCEIAIVCAPNIVLNPAMQMVSSIGGLLAPDG